MKGAGEASPEDEPCMQVGICSHGGSAHPHPRPATQPQLWHWRSWDGRFCPIVYMHFQHLKHEHAMGPVQERNVSPDPPQAFFSRLWSPMGCRSAGERTVRLGALACAVAHTQHPGQGCDGAQRDF